MRETGCLKGFHGESSFNVINYLLICRLCKESFLIFNLPKNPDTLRLLFLNTFITPERISWLSLITECTSRLKISEITSRVHTAAQTSSSGLHLLTDWQLLPPQSLCSQAFPSAGKTVSNASGAGAPGTLSGVQHIPMKIVGIHQNAALQPLLTDAIKRIDLEGQKLATWANLGELRKMYKNW